MFVEAKPIGVTPTSPLDRMPVLQHTSGDVLEITTRVKLPQSNTPATPENSELYFAISETQFLENIWTATWADVTEIDPEDHPGLISIVVPSDIADSLRRGAYKFSLDLAWEDDTRAYKNVVLAGTIEVDYQPTSPTKNIPYRNN